jgi:hypothetical protein
MNPFSKSLQFLRVYANVSIQIIIEYKKRKIYKNGWC